MIKTQLQENQEIAQALIQMFQSGYLAGYNTDRGKQHRYKKIREKCKKAFERLYMHQLKNKIQNQVKLNNQAHIEDKQA